MIPCVDEFDDGSMIVSNQSALNELAENNCTMPNIDNVVYNLGTKAYQKLDEKGHRMFDEDHNPILGEPKPVLSTTVYFCDNTKVTVLNSENDPINLIDHTLSNGEVIKVADRASKERGLLYAIFKRMVSIPNDEGKLVDSGLGRILNYIVDNSQDGDVNAREAKITKQINKAEFEKAKNNPKKPRYSIYETLVRQNELLDKYTELLDKYLAK